MECLLPALADWGVPDAHIHFEAFGPASIKRIQAASSAVDMSQKVAAATGIVVTFARSARQLAWQPAAGSLLEFAEANGVAVNSGCRAGGCGSCQTAIRTGEVTYLQPPDFDPELGTCLLCVSTPKSSVTLEA
jgi:ferredoxin